MTAIELKAQIQQGIDLLADDESGLQRVANYIKRLLKKKEDPTLMSKEDFFRRIDEARAQYDRGDYTRVNNIDELHEFLSNIEEEAKTLEDVSH